ncbi:hypothetical protein [Teredinibacter turnerae]|nr:hypothetical protein [Teredinibacter turnerae]
MFLHLNPGYIAIMGAHIVSSDELTALYSPIDSTGLYQVAVVSGECA